MSSSRSLIHRLTPFFAARIRMNHRLLSSSSALPERQSPSPSLDDVHLTENCVRRMKELQADEAKEKMLRLSIEAGGCSGFQYNFMLDDKSDADDRIFERDGVKLVVDKISLDFVKGATIDYVEELIRSAFQSNLDMNEHQLLEVFAPYFKFINHCRGIHKSKCSRRMQL